MNRRIVLPILILVLAFSLSPSAGWARSNSAKPKATPVHHHTVIGSVSADSITVNEPGGSKTYKITISTEITFKGETVTVDKLQAGMRVTVTADAADDSVAGQITANDPPVDPTPKPTPAKK